MLKQKILTIVLEHVFIDRHCFSFKNDIHSYKKIPLFLFELMQTFGGSGANSKGSTWKGQTYRSGCPLLDKLQSYNLRSSSVDSMVNDSYNDAYMIQVLESEKGEGRHCDS